MSSLKVIGSAPLRSSRGIALIGACALGAILFTGAGGGLVYFNTQRLIETRQWLEHTHQVLTSLQSESQRLDRISNSMQLYGLTHEARDLRSAVTAAGAMQVGTITLKNLVVDNP